jgi:hypothetical protein
MVIDTLFLCFCEDFTQNDGSPGKEYYAPPSLMAFMNEAEHEVAMTPLNNQDVSSKRNNH